MTHSANQFQPAPTGGMLGFMRQVIVYPDPESGAWVCEVPSLPGCLSDGPTKDAALENVRDAIRAWLEAAQELGWDVPTETQSAEVHLVSP